MQLRWHLEKKGLTQQALADALDIPRNTVWRWVNERSIPSTEMLQRLAIFFKTSTDALLNGPAGEGYRVILKYTKTLEGVNDEMMITGMELTVSDDGYIGVAWRAKFEGREDIDKALEKVRAFMEEGFESRERMRKKWEGKAE
jgi:transcriptional regulator with XRE-family HTH domain